MHNTMMLITASLTRAAVERGGRSPWYDRLITFLPLRIVALAVSNDLRQEPGSALGLVDPVLDQAGGGDVVVLIADLMSRAQVPGQLQIVGAKLGQHVLRRHELGVVVFQALMLRDVPDRVDRSPADFARP